MNGHDVWEAVALALMFLAGFVAGTAWFADVRGRQ